MFTRLIAWFAAHRRPMPWRKHPAPYPCWLSEIMLQQTTYEQALPYYQRFLTRFPTVRALADAGLPDVLKAWEGLGYYARARNLHAAARLIAPPGKRPKWPQDAAAWQALPGIGPYTAAALSSVLNDEPVAVVDGNVARVFSRVWMLTDDFKKLPPRQALAKRLETNMCGKPGDFNQAMMELGALVCTPASPKCAECPLAADCRAYAAGCPEDYPVSPKKGPVPVRAETAVVIRDAQGRVLLVEQTEGGLLKGLWDLPVLSDGGLYEQAFSHFKLKRRLLTAAAPARFVNPAEVPLTLAAKKAIARTTSA